MSRTSDSSDGDARRYSRRAVVRRGLAAAAGTVAVGGTVHGQEETDGETPTRANETGANETEPDPDDFEDVRTTVKGVVTEQGELTQDLTGFWLHLARELDPVQASVADACDYVDWADEDTRTYDAVLVDRTADPQTVQTQLYLHDTVRVTSGQLFIINYTEDCEGAYKGVQLERIGASYSSIVSGTTPAPTQQSPEGLGDGGGGAGQPTGGTGAGLGALTGVGSLLAGGWLLGRKRGD